MSKQEDKIKEILHDELQTLELKAFVKWNRKICATAVTALLAIGTTVGNWVMNHSDRAYNAMHVLVFGEMPK